MIKFTECVRRLPRLSHEEFLDYWLNTHGPLVKGLAADLKMGRYVQSHTIAHPIHDAIRQVARQTGVDFSIDVTINRDHKITSVYAGDNV